MECVPAQSHAPRGPKKGHLRALETRLGELEQKLLEQQQQNLLLSPPTTEQIDFLDGSTNLDTYLGLDGSDSSNSLLMPPTLEDPAMPPELELPSTFTLPESLRSELDQLYFERTHPFVPFLNRHRYLSQSRLPAKSESQICLQHAMWTIASVSSAQLCHIRDSTYEYTRRMLESLEAKDNRSEFADIEHVQARVLLLVYEFMRTNHQRGCISAGRCFRLIQLMRLYEIDPPENVAKRQGDAELEDWIKTECKRRTFWVAYSLDRFINMRHEWPLTLNEQDVFVRLPAPEEGFQSGKYVEMGFLSEAITSTDLAGASPFAELIIIATICGRALSHRQQSIAEPVSSLVPQLFWDRHECLYTMLKARYNILVVQYPAAMQQTDCMLLFTNMMVQTTVLYLNRVIESIPWETVDNSALILDFKQKALIAAKETVNLTTWLPDISYFKTPTIAFPSSTHSLHSP